MARAEATDRRPKNTGRQFRHAVLASLAELAAAASGVTAIEYACIAGLVAMAIVAVVTTLGTSVSGLFVSVLGGF